MCVSIREFVFNHWKGREGAATAFLQVDEPEKTFSFPVDFCESCPFALDRSPCCHRALLSIVYCSAVVVTPRGGRLLLYGMEFRPGYGDGVYSLRHTSVSLSLSLLRLIPVSVFLANFNKLLVVRHLGILFIDERERREEKRRGKTRPSQTTGPREMRSPTLLMGEPCRIPRRERRRRDAERELNFKKEGNGRRTELAGNEE